MSLQSLSTSHFLYDFETLGTAFVNRVKNRIIVETNLKVLVIFPLSFYVNKYNTI
jgi:hypothetical protein